MKNRKLEHIYQGDSIDGLIPGVKGNRAFPYKDFKSSNPFLMLDHIGPQTVGAEWALNGDGHDHPHRGFETITFLFEGQMEHRDSQGNRASLTSGSVQRMNAGSGIIHGGDMGADKQTARFHEMQLWVNNPRIEKMSTPEIHNVNNSEIPAIVENHYKLRVVAGSLNGLQGPIQTKANTHIGHLITKEEAEVKISGFADQHRLLVYVMEGTMKIDGQLVNESQLATFNDSGAQLAIESVGEAQALILIGEPIEEPVAFDGPFVMNTHAEIEEAYADFEKGLFGKITQEA